MVGLQTLDLAIGVRVPASQPFFLPEMSVLIPMPPPSQLSEPQSGFRDFGKGGQLL
jgi:hypothetical protein